MPPNCFNIWGLYTEVIGIGSHIWTIYNFICGLIQFQVIWPVVFDIDTVAVIDSVVLVN